MNTMDPFAQVRSDMQLPNSMCKYIFCNQQQSFNALQNGNVSVFRNKMTQKSQVIKKTIDAIPATAQADL